MASSLPPSMEGSIEPVAVDVSVPSGGAPSGGGGGGSGIGVAGGGQQLATLDEPVSTTILRDLRQVATKLRYVLLPNPGGGSGGAAGGDSAATLRELRNWDLWGPLLLCLVLSILLSLSAPAGQASLVFASVFVIVWAGAAVVTVNAQLLGGQISFFQSVCVLGYCIFPLVLAAGLCAAWSHPVWKSLVVVTALVWATRGEWVVVVLVCVVARWGASCAGVWVGGC